jgi:hypothetical protein
MWKKVGDYHLGLNLHFLMRLDDEKIVVTADELLKRLDPTAIAAHFGTLSSETKEHKEFVTQKELLILGYTQKMLALMRQYQVCHFYFILVYS